MTRYLLLMLNKDMASADPKQREENMKAWTEWLSVNQSKLDGGLPVMRNGKIIKRRSVKEYTAKTTDLGGYLIIKADSEDEAIKIAQSTPHARMGGGKSIIRECREMQ